MVDEQWNGFVETQKKFMNNVQEFMEHFDGILKVLRERKIKKGNEAEPLFTDEELKKIRTNKF